MARMSRALLVDLDGVVRTWDPRITAQAETRHGLPTGSIAATAFAVDLLLRVVTGRITDDSWRDEVTARLESAHGPTARAAVLDWSEPVGEVDRQVLGIVREVRRRMPVVLVTNATSRLSRDLSALSLDAEFDAVVNSSEVGVAKPAAGIFLRACELVGAAPDGSLFVDDSAANVDAAVALGFSGHVFESVDGLRAFLANSATAL